MNPLRRDAKCCERLFHLCHEAIRSADVDIRLWWKADFIEYRSRQVTNRIKTIAHRVARGRPAITNVAATLRQREHEAANFGTEGMMLAIARRLQPQDPPCRV